MFVDRCAGGRPRAGGAGQPQPGQALYAFTRLCHPSIFSLLTLYFLVLLVCFSALVISTGYAQSRLQFGPNKGPEICLMDYPSHQQRLIPLIGTVMFSFNCN